MQCVYSNRGIQEICVKKYNVRCGPLRTTKTKTLNTKDESLPIFKILDTRVKQKVLNQNVIVAKYFVATVIVKLVRVQCNCKVLINH